MEKLLRKEEHIAALDFPHECSDELIDLLLPLVNTQEVLAMHKNQPFCSWHIISFQIAFPVHLFPCNNGDVFFKKYRTKK